MSEHDINVTLSRADRDAAMAVIENSIHNYQGVIRVWKEANVSVSAAKVAEMQEAITQRQRILQALCNKPVHEHGCDRCTFLGTTYGWLGTGHDLYYCSIEPTVLARSGSDGDDYTSGIYPAVLAHSPLLREALRRALAVAGLLHPEARERLEEHGVIDKQGNVVEPEVQA